MRENRPKVIVYGHSQLREDSAEHLNNLLTPGQTDVSNVRFLRQEAPFRTPLVFISGKRLPGSRSQCSDGATRASSSKTPFHPRALSRASTTSTRTSSARVSYHTQWPSNMDSTRDLERQLPAYKEVQRFQTTSLLHD